MDDEGNDEKERSEWLAVQSIPAVSSSSSLMLPCQDKPKGGFCFRYFLHAQVHLLNTLHRLNVVKPGALK